MSLSLSRLSTKGSARFHLPVVPLFLSFTLASLSLTASFSLTAASPVFAADSKETFKQKLGRLFSFKLSQTQEEALGKEMDLNVRKQFKVSTDSRASQAVQTLMGKLAASAHPAFPIKITVLEEPEIVNAFAIPGGYIYVTRGMLNLVDNDAQLAGVLGHELAHVTQNHVSQRVSNQTTANLAVRLMSRLSEKDLEKSRVTSLVKLVVFQKFSRDAEYEADRVGLDYMAQAGYNPLAMAQVKDKFLAITNDKMSIEFLSSHPNTSKRKAEILALIKEKNLVKPGQIMETRDFLTALGKSR